MPKTIIANWKMEKSNAQALAWCNAHKNELAKLIEASKINLVLCPSTSFLACAQTILQNSLIKLGAQDCGIVELGSYTGDTSILSLAEMNVSHCIIGHSERRKLYCESDRIVAQKAELLIKFQILPIVCVGESHEQREANHTQKILKSQVDQILEKISDRNIVVYIAYEPIWAIGSGKAADTNLIIDTVSYIQELTGDFTNIKLLYGGSVTDKNICELNEINELSGFLLGKSSLDFQMLKKIVLSIVQTPKFN